VAALAAALWLAAPVARAQTAPEVRHAPDASYEAGTPGSFDLDLQLVTGATPTPDVSDQEVCRNGVGDESCGIYLVLTTSGDASISGFAPVGGAVRSNQVSATELRIVKLAASGTPAGDFGTLSLGSVSLSRPTSGTLDVDPASRWVRADRVMEPLLEGSSPEPVGVPEPGSALGLGIGALLLAGLAARRRARHRAAVGAVLGLAAAVVTTAPASAQLYFDRDAFETALASSTVQEEDFEGVALDGNGYAGFGNGATFGDGAFSYTSLSLATDVDLFEVGGSSTGLQGTLLVAEGTPPETTVSIVGFPGGEGPTDAVYGDSILTGGACACTPHPLLGCRDAKAKILGPPDGQSAVLRNGGVYVYFEDNVLRGGGTSAADLVIHRDTVPGATGTTFVAISVGVQGSGLDQVYGANVPRTQGSIAIDLDAEGYGQGAALDTVLVATNGGSTASCLQLTPDPSYDAIETRSGGAEDEDSFRLDFATPVEAAGLRIYNNSAQSGEVVEFLDEQGGVIVSTPLAHGDTYFGFVSPTEPISAIVVIENPDPGEDDIRFDEVLWAQQVAYLPIDEDFTPSAQARDWVQLGVDQIGTGPGGLEANDIFGADVANIGDLNGDGVVDVAVGAVLDGDGGTNRGAVYLFFLERDGTVRGEPRKISALEGGLPLGLLVDEDQFGRSVVGLGDLDGDTIPDMAVGAHADGDPSAKGRLFILFMNQDGTVKEVETIGEGQGGLQGALGADAAFGASVANLGDLDGDGVIDLAVGAEKDTDGGVASGTVWILFLNDDGTVKAESKIGAGSAALAGALDPDDNFGQSSTGLGDLDRDGVPDVAVGASGDDENGTNRGAAWVLFLNDDGTLKSTTKLTDFALGAVDGLIIDPEQDWDLAGTALAWIPTPEIPSQGVLAVGVAGRDIIGPLGVDWGSGGLYFVAFDEAGNPGAVSGIVRTEGPLGGPEPGSFTPPYGEAHALGANGATYLGDLDGDGFPDVATGALTATVDGLSQVGAAYVFFLSGFDPTAYADGETSPACACSFGPPFSCGDQASSIVGVRDFQGAVLRNGTIAVQFADNAARGDGTSSPDVVIHRVVFPGAGSTTSDVTVRAAGADQSYATVFDDAVELYEETIEVDLDAGGFGPSSEVRFIEITNSGAQQSSCVSISDDPLYDAVEAVDNLNLRFDRDDDGVVDALDVCRQTPNPGQTDSDGDGAGDICDNCPAVSNPDQRDGDGDGKGNFCDGGEYILSRLDDLSTTFELRYRCPGDASENRLDVAIALPPSATNATFGGFTPATSCDEPQAAVSIPNPPIGYQPGNGCFGATDLGLTVTPSLSGVLGPGLSGPSGVRTDAMYLRLEGVPVICEPNQEVGLGILDYDGLLEEVPVLTSRGVETPGLQLDASAYQTGEAFSGQEPTVTCYDDPQMGTTCRWPRIRNEVTAYDLKLEPAPGEPVGAETAWQVCVTADGEFYRLSFGLQAPPGSAATPAEFYWEGCDGTPSGPDNQRTCGGPYASPYQQRVATTNSGLFQTDSETFGPVPTDPVPTLFVALEGLDVGEENFPALNTADFESCVGRAVLTTTPGVPPELTINGIGALPRQPGLLGAYDSDDAGTDLDAVSTLDVTLTYVSEGSEDTDNDSVRDEDDNCRFLANTGQTNTGGLLSTVGTDNVGDDCQCGDLDFDGAILSGGGDLDLLVDVLLGIETSTAVVNRASVADSKDVDLRDAVFLQLGLDGKLPSLDQVCEDGTLPLP